MHYSQLTLAHKSQVNLCFFSFSFCALKPCPFPYPWFSHNYSAAHCFRVMIYFHFFSQFTCLSVYLFLLSSCLFIKTMCLLLRSFLFNERSCKKCLWGLEKFFLNLFHDSFLCDMFFLCLLFITLTPPPPFLFLSCERYVWWWVSFQVGPGTHKELCVGSQINKFHSVWQFAS